MFSPAFLSLFMKIPLLCSLQISVKLTAKILSLSPQNVMAKRIAKRFAVTSSVVTIYDTIRYDTISRNSLFNKCIGDDTKAADRQSPNCI